MTYKELLTVAEKKYPPNVDLSSAKLILAKLANWSLSKLYANLNEEITIDNNKFFDLVQEYIDGKPLQYIIGEQNFFGTNFVCEEGVFIARYETEELVENTLNLLEEIFDDDKKLLGLDLGTGMGVIGLTLAIHRPNSQIIGVDINAKAIALANKNQKLLGVKNINFILGDMLEPVENQKFDFIVANPPYIDINSKIDKRVRNYEPITALFAPNEGLYYYQYLFERVHDYLNPQYLLAFEFGYDQKDKLEILVKKYFPKSNYKFLEDINKKWRMLFIWKV